MILWVPKLRSQGYLNFVPRAILQSYANVSLARSSPCSVLHAFKLVSNHLRYFLCGFRENSQWSDIGRFWAKSGFSVSARDRSNLPETPPTCLQWVPNCLRDCLCGFRVNSQGSEVDRFWAKLLGPWFWKWRILVSALKRSKLLETRNRYIRIFLHGPFPLRGFPWWSVEIVVQAKFGEYYWTGFIICKLYTNFFISKMKVEFQRTSRVIALVRQPQRRSLEELNWRLLVYHTLHGLIDEKHREIKTKPDMMGYRVTWNNHRAKGELIILCGCLH